MPEINNHGHSTLNTIMVQEGYPSNAVYHRVQFDMGTAKPVKTAGWTTSAKTRPQLLDALCQSLDEGAIEVNDREFLAECRTFNLIFRTSRTHMGLISQAGRRCQVRCGGASGFWLAAGRVR